MSIIGIDLGTTTSEAAFYQNNKSEIIKNIEEGDSPIIPSVVLIEQKNVKVGIKAKNQMVLKPQNTIIEIKKLMGTDKKVNIDGKEYTPVQISAIILKRIKEIAEYYTGEKVTDAVITVPANFNERARKDTKKAGEIAGLNVERIINEPTAAAIAYGINNIEKNINILVYDFGGGTIDVTVLELYNGVLDVKCSRGADIGGKDIDEVIIKHICKCFYEENKINLDLNNLRIKSVLKNVSEECKKNLSFQNEWDVIVPYITTDENKNPLDLNITITANELNKLIEDIVSSTEKIIDDTLEGADLVSSDIDKVIMVGGSTRVLSVKNMIRKKFGADKIVIGINPDETVAIGAAIQCAIKNNNIDSEKSIIVTDSCSYTLGVEVFGNKFDPIIKRDSKLPAMVTKSYRTVEDNQEEAEINIYEGEDEEVKNNLRLDSILINNIPKNKKGKEVIDITFKYDLNGILNVDVKVRSTGAVKTIEIKDEKKSYNNSNLEFEKGLDSQSKETILCQENDPINRDVYDEKSNLSNITNEFNPVKNHNSNNSEQSNDATVSSQDLFAQAQAILNADEESQKQKEKEEKEAVYAEYDVPDDGDDYGTVFTEVAALSKYIDGNLKNYDENIQSMVRDNIQELAVATQKEDFKRCRQLEHRILRMMGIE